MGQSQLSRSGTDRDQIPRIFHALTCAVRESYQEVPLDGRRHLEDFAQKLSDLRRAGSQSHSSRVYRVSARRQLLAMIFVAEATAILKYGGAGIQLNAS
jgi:hypothetical protein